MSTSNLAGPYQSSVLILSGTVPGEPGVGGVILQDLALSPFGQSMRCACIPTRQAFEQNWMSRCPVDCSAFSRRYDTGWRPFRGLAGEFCGYQVRKTLFRRHTRRLVNDIAQQFRNSGIRRVWAVLDCPTVIEVADRVSDALSVPLSVMVWDAPELLADQLTYDRWSQRSLLIRFGEVIRHADRVGVICEQMQSAYEQRFGKSNYVIMRHGIDESLTRDLSITRSSSTMRIGFAGSITAPEVFQQLIRMLDAAQWSLENRTVTLRLIGSRYLLDSRSPQSIEYFGWRSSSETIGLLSECDILYLPQPFAPHLRDLAELSFPTKLGTYLAAAKPVLLHSPTYGSITPFFERFKLGEICNSLDHEGLRKAIARLCRLDHTVLQHSINSARKEEFSRNVFLSRFEQLTGPFSKGTGDKKLINMEISANREAK